MLLTRLKVCRLYQENRGSIFRTYLQFNGQNDLILSAHINKEVFRAVLSLAQCLCAKECITEQYYHMEREFYELCILNGFLLFIMCFNFCTTRFTKYGEMMLVE